MLAKLKLFLILGLVFGALGGSSYYLWQYNNSLPKKVVSYQDILLGDSKDQVFYALGKPQHVLESVKDSADERVVEKETLDKNPDHEKAFDHWQYLYPLTITDIYFDSNSKKTVSIGCSKFVPPKPEAPKPEGQGASAPGVKGKPSKPPAPPPLIAPPQPTPAEAAAAPATDLPPPPAAPLPPAADASPAPADASATAPQPAGEPSACNIIGVKIGDKEDSVLARLGKPKSVKYDGVYKTILYPHFNLAIKMEKRVVIFINAVKGVASSKPSGEETP